jgi:hypothetical protein
MIAKKSPNPADEHAQDLTAGLATMDRCQKHSQRAMSKQTVILTRNVSSPLVIGTDPAIAADAPGDRIATGGANPESSEIHSTRPSWMPDACA